MLVFIILMVHFISGISLYIYFVKTGEMEKAAKYGDGIWFAKPTDLIFYCVFVSEFYWLIIFCIFVETSIDIYFENKYK